MYDAAKLDKIVRVTSGRGRGRERANHFQDAKLKLKNCKNCKGPFILEIKSAKKASIRSNATFQISLVQNGNACRLVE